MQRRSRNVGGNTAVWHCVGRGKGYFVGSEERIDEWNDGLVLLSDALVCLLMSRGFYPLGSLLLFA